MNPSDDFRLHRAQSLTRRHFFGRLGLGFGALALDALAANAKAVRAASGSPSSSTMPRRSSLCTRALFPQLSR